MSSMSKNIILVKIQFFHKIIRDIELIILSHIKITKCPIKIKNTNYLNLRN